MNIEWHLHFSMKCRIIHIALWSKMNVSVIKILKDGEKSCNLQTQLQQFHLLLNTNFQSKWILDWQLQLSMKFWIIHTALRARMKVFPK
jgi:hypothetical protein